MRSILVVTLLLRVMMAPSLLAQNTTTEGEEKLDGLVEYLDAILNAGVAVAALLDELDSVAARGCAPGTFPSTCGALLPLVDATLSHRTSGAGTAGAWYATWEAGGLARVGRRTAAGATAFANVDSRGRRLGVRARLRQWVGDELTLEIGPGVYLSASEEAIGAPGFAGLLAVGTHDAGLLFQAERIEAARSACSLPPARCTSLPPPPPVWRTYLGMRLRGSAAAALTVIEFAIVGIVATIAF